MWVPAAAVKAGLKLRWRVMCSRVMMTGFCIPLWSCCSTAWHGSSGQLDQRSCGGDTVSGHSVPTPRDNPGERNYSWALWDEKNFSSNELETYISSYKSSEKQKLQSLHLFFCIYICISFLPVWATCVSLKLPQQGWFVPCCLLSSLDRPPLGGSGAFAQPGESETFIQADKDQSLKMVIKLSVWTRQCRKVEQDDDVDDAVLTITCCYMQLHPKMFFSNCFSLNWMEIKNTIYLRRKICVFVI